MMDKIMYLLNVEISGVKSIKNKVKLDFYKKTVDKNFDSSQYRVKAIYGENGAGKSALVTAIQIYRELMWRSNYLSEGKNQEFLGEIVNKITKKLYISMEFLAKMTSRQTVYKYEFEIGKSEGDEFQILHEKLQRKNGNYQNNRYTQVFECRDGELVYLNGTSDLVSYMEKMTANLLSRQSLVTIFTSKILNDIVDKNYIDFFQNVLIDIISMITFNACISVYIEEQDQHELYFWRKKMADKKINEKSFGDMFSEYNELYKSSLGVNEKYISKTDFENYEKKIGQLTEFIKIFKPGLQCIDIEKRDDGDRYKCELNLNYGDYSVNKEFESTGIKKLIRLFDCLQFASTLGIVFIDELDSNLNDVYLCKMIEYFMYYGKGQLCFTTHNIDPMLVLRDNKNSIDFLTNENTIVPWVAKGNAAPDSYYRNGMIKDLPFNIEASDFVGILGGEE